MTQPNWNPSDKYKKVAEANLQAYRRSASRYDRTETCVVSRRHQAMLRNDLDYLLATIRRHQKGRVSALDACGGSGNVALRLLSRGVDVTLCDISPEMTRLFESKCKERKLSHYSIVCEEIGSFLASAMTKFDLIVFSAALHHIEDYTSVLAMAACRLNKRGLIYTALDPVRYDIFTRKILWIETIFDAAMKYPGEACSTARRRLFARLRQIDPSRLTEYEYHVKSGIDDYSLVDSLRRLGLEMLLHKRYTDARYTPTRLLLTALKCPTSFNLILRAP